MTTPRSVRLALWWPEAAGDAARVQRAVRAVTADDEPHVVREPDGTERPLADLLAVPARTAAVLPRPGRVAPVPAPASPAALAAGEAVLVETAAGAAALVPRVTRFGSDLEPGHLVAWQRIEVPPWRAGFAAEVGTMADADRAVRIALAEAATVLEDLDLAPADPAPLQRSGSPGPGLPPDLSGPRLALLTLGLRLVTVAEGVLGQGAAGGLEDRRRAVLREVAEAARRAVAAATGA